MSDFGYNLSDMERLSELLGAVSAADQDGTEHGEEHINPTKDKMPQKLSENVAKPFAKVEATVNNRRLGDTATKQENVVWNPEEVKEFAVDKDEKRPRPDFEVV